MGSTVMRLRPVLPELVCRGGCRRFTNSGLHVLPPWHPLLNVAAASIPGGPTCNLLEAATICSLGMTGSALWEMPWLPMRRYAPDLSQSTRRNVRELG